MNKRSLGTLLSLVSLAGFTAFGCGDDDIEDDGSSSSSSSSGAQSSGSQSSGSTSSGAQSSGSTSSSSGAQSSGSTSSGGSSSGSTSSTSSSSGEGPLTDGGTDGSTDDGSVLPAATWIADEWGTCSAVCGGGMQTRAVTCKRDGASVEPGECVGAAPAASQACNTEPCGEWVSSEWGECSKTCGGGTQTRTNQCQVNGANVDPGLCLDAQPDTSRACNEEACGDVELGAFHTDGTCGVLGLIGPGFTLTPGQNVPLPVGTTITILASGVANSGVWSVTGGTATVTVLSNTSRLITLTAALPANATLAMRTTLSISTAFTLNATVTLPMGYVGTGAKTSGSVSSSLILCSAT